MWSAPITVTPPTGEVVTLEQAKTYLRVDGTALDDQITQFIKAAIATVEVTSSTRLLTQTVKLSADSFADLEVLPIGPVVTINEVQYLDTVGALQTLDPSSYEQFGAGLEVGIRPAINCTWPQIRPVVGAIRVTMTVGYGAAADVPADLWLAIVRLVRGMLDDEPADVSAELVNHRVWL
jgi:uncharacterized phiE125 gp8 family phage protein